MDAKWWIIIAVLLAIAVPLKLMLYKKVLGKKKEEKEEDM